LINDVPDGPGDRRTNGPRTIAALVAALAATLAAAAIAGCGGGGSESSSTSTSASVSTTSTSSTHTTATDSTTTSTGPTVTVKGANHPSTPGAAVKLLLLSSNPRTGCSGNLVTSHYLHAAYGGRAGCVKAVTPRSAAKSLGRGTGDIVGDKAFITVHPVGGIYDGEKITVSLVRSDGGWQVDGIKSNAPVGP
jgi:hypothetical protein